MRSRTDSGAIPGKSGLAWCGLGLVLVLVLAASALWLTACGEKAAEKTIEKAMEEAAKESGQNVDVDVDVNSGSASVSVSGQDGGMQWQAGSDVKLPEGFPASLIPKGAKVIAVYTAGQEQSVTFQTEEESKKVFDYFLKALGDLGYEITDKFTAEQDGQTMIALAGEKADGQVMVSGGQQSDGAIIYTVVLTPGS